MCWLRRRGCFQNVGKKMWWLRRRGCFQNVGKKCDDSGGEDASRMLEKNMMTPEERMLPECWKKMWWLRRRGCFQNVGKKMCWLRRRGCFQNVGKKCDDSGGEDASRTLGKNVMTPEESTLKTDMCKWVFGNYGLKKISAGHIWTTLYIRSKQEHSLVWMTHKVYQPATCEWQAEM